MIAALRPLTHSGLRAARPAYGLLPVGTWITGRCPPLGRYRGGDACTVVA